MRIWLSLVTALAALKAVVGLALSTRSLLAGTHYANLWVFLFQIGVYFFAACFLLLGSRRDRRAMLLAAAFCMVAASFAYDPIAVSAEKLPAPFNALLGSLNWLTPDSFLPLLVWLFVADFPQRPADREPERFLITATRTSWLAGVLLFALNFLLPWLGHDFHIIEAFDSRNMTAVYWGVIYGLILPAFPYALRQSRFTTLSERRRVRLFIAGLTLAAVPVSLYIMFASILPDQWRQLRDTTANGIALVVIQVLVLSVPMTTSYSVIVGRVLGFNLIVRKVVQYALARGTIIMATAIPFAAGGIFLYRHREESISSLVSGTRLYALLLVLFAGAAGLMMRERIMRVIDRRFFREQYDSRSILAGLIAAARRVDDSGSLAQIVRAELNSSLHVDPIALLTLDPASGQYADVDRRVTPLRKSSMLASLLAGNPIPLHVELEYRGAALSHLPVEERQWLAAGNFRLLIPVIGTGNHLIGIIALGEKRSELPFSKEDLMLLSDVAASAALALENRLLKSPSPDSVPTNAGGFQQETAGRELALDIAAVQCSRCKLILLPGDSACPECGGSLSGAVVPKVLAGKFRIEKQVGAGGMGVVFLAEDLELARKVAIKTLPQMSPERVMRFKREARAMAAVMHRNLTLIFGVEYWLGTPMLILEFLEGGTLAERIRHERFTPLAGVDLGICLADALGRIHSASIVHRDIKPSNIGYAIDGTPKLMDFGLARMLVKIRSESGDIPKNSDLESTAEAYAASNLAGTLAYLPPEAFAGRISGVRSDLWALGLVLFESIAGRHPFKGDTAAETLRNIQYGTVPDLGQFVPGCSESLSAFFRSALCQNSALRPASALEFAARLKALQRELED